MAAESTTAAAAESKWTVAVALFASICFALPLIVNGTPDEESYQLSIFSTVAFVRNLLAGVDPWFVSNYGFGVPLPSSSWFIKFPLALPAAALGIRPLYAALWIGGEFVCAFYLLKLVREVTASRGIAVFALLTALLSFSNLSPSYVDDWPEHFLGWALFPGCIWFILQTVRAESLRQRINAGATCAFVLGVFAGSTHQNEIVTFYSGLVVLLAFLVWTRPAGGVAVAIAAVISLISASTVLVPTIQGLLSAGVNPVAGDITVAYDDLTIRSYGVFAEPLRTWVTAGPFHLLREGLPPDYQRVPFFGLIALLLAAVGAVRLLISRHGAGRLPRDISRMVAVGFLVNSVLTLLPAWAMLGLPRMWMYRDAQTVFAVICAAVTLEWICSSYPRWFAPLLTTHALQMSLAAAPLLAGVIVSSEHNGLWAYQRAETSLFSELRLAGVNAQSRVVVAGDLENLTRGGLYGAGVTAGTDFPLQGIALVNSWYRGGQTPMLGSAMDAMDGRYGNYESEILWSRDLRHLRPAGLDVLGITHVLALTDDPDALAWSAHLRETASMLLSNGRRIALFANDDAWDRVVFLERDAGEPQPRPECASRTVYCRDYRPLAMSVQSRVEAVRQGGVWRVSLPEGHAGGQLFVSEAVGRHASATIDGASQKVRPFLEVFASVDVPPGAQMVTISAFRKDRMALTLLGAGVLAICLVVAALVRPDGSGSAVSA